MVVENLYYHESAFLAPKSQGSTSESSVILVVLPREFGIMTRNVCKLKCGINRINDVERIRADRQLWQVLDVDVPSINFDALYTFDDTLYGVHLSYLRG